MAISVTRADVPIATKASSPMSFGTTIMGISAVAGAISSYYSGKTQQIGYEMQAAQRKSQAAEARSAAKFNALKLKRNYNEITANQAIKFASQGRSFTSGSIQNILREDQERLNWDLDYNELSSEISESAILANTEQFNVAGRLARQGGIQKGLLGIGQSLIDYSKVK